VEGMSSLADTEAPGTGGFLKVQRDASSRNDPWSDWAAASRPSRMPHMPRMSGYELAAVITRNQ
jgi:hypothetical protein